MQLDATNIIEHRFYSGQVLSAHCCLRWLADDNSNMNNKV